MTVDQEFVSFRDNLADKGEAMYMYLFPSFIHVNHTSSLEFVNKTA